jgi:hypothetical protein
VMRAHHADADDGHADRWAGGQMRRGVRRHGPKPGAASGVMDPSLARRHVPRTVPAEPLARQTFDQKGH